MLIQSTIAAIIPAAIYMSLIYWVDRYEKEPLWLIAATFLWGAIPAVILALIFNLLFGLPFYAIFGDGLGDALVASLVAPLVEETVKGAALVIIFFMWRDQIDGVLDGIIYGAVVGMGFAMIENIFYFESVFAEGGVEAWQTNIFMRAVVFGLNHSLYSAMTGLGIAIARLNKTMWIRIAAPIGGLFLAMFLHFVHNASASAGGILGDLVCIPLLANAWGGVFITIIIMIWALVQERRWLHKYLAAEVASGTLTQNQYEAAVSNFGRIGHNFDILSKQGLGGYFASRRFFQKCSKLAYLKHHQDWYHDEESRRKLVALQQSIADDSGRLTVV